MDPFGRVGARGWWHVRCVDCPRETGARSTDPVVLASVVKVPLVLEFARQVVAGQVDPTERVRLRDGDRLGGSGTAGCLDDVEMSLRDLARLALSISDNTAADALFRRVGVDNVRSLVAELGMPETRILGGPRDIVASMVSDVAAADTGAFALAYPELSVAEVRGLSALDPRRGSASTPAELTRLLRLVWRDEAGPPEACAMLRGWMTRQVGWHRLAGGFPDDVGVAAKTGTMPGIRNEIGVVTYPDGRRYAVAVGAVLDALDGRQFAVDVAIGRAAAAAVDTVRATCTH
ncbi:serine hydrolase [Actinocatenispora rupis]|uniref:Serine hydrolase n=1 Tax=Actinocatenispora rupis TaxID=519421 RepID=A0A8J3JAY8_9ACTN|nr:serine hydrolase [Actinocatenispora rupis]GID13404.1 serine hydrolase [Actinocatenispora rupis]